LVCLPSVLRTRKVDAIAHTPSFNVHSIHMFNTVILFIHDLYDAYDSY
jgi:hypothetical protein